MSDYNPANSANTYDPLKVGTDHPPKESYDHFYRRTNRHIELVRQNLSLWCEKNNSLAIDLWERAYLHDRSKFNEPERTPYVWRTWKSYCDLNNISFQYPEGMEQQVRDAIFHHITHNRHHPEWHPDPDEMTKIDLIEMVCDWKAMGQEFGEKSPMGWADRVLGRRFHFSQYKCDLIRDLIREMDSLFEEDKLYKEAIEKITPSNKELLDMVDRQNNKETR